jgi:hypothetical protein
MSSKTARRQREDKAKLDENAARRAAAVEASKLFWKTHDRCTCGKVKETVDDQCYGCRRAEKAELARKEKLDSGLWDECPSCSRLKKAYCYVCYLCRFPDETCEEETVSPVKMSRASARVVLKTDNSSVVSKTSGGTKVSRGSAGVPSLELSEDEQKPRPKTLKEAGLSW